MTKTDTASATPMSELPVAQLPDYASCGFSGAPIVTVHMGFVLYTIGAHEAAQLCRLGRPWVMAQPCRPRMTLLGRSV